MKLYLFEQLLVYITKGENICVFIDTNINLDHFRARRRKIKGKLRESKYTTHTPYKFTVHTNSLVCQNQGHLCSVNLSVCFCDLCRMCILLSFDGLIFFILSLINVCGSLPKILLFQSFYFFAYLISFNLQIPDLNFSHHKSFGTKFINACTYQ